MVYVIKTRPPGNPLRFPRASAQMQNRSWFRRLHGTPSCNKTLTGRVVAGGDPGSSLALVVKCSSFFCTIHLASSGVSRREHVVFAAF